MIASPTVAAVIVAARTDAESVGRYQQISDERRRHRDAQERHAEESARGGLGGDVGTEKEPCRPGTEQGDRGSSQNAQSEMREEGAEVAATDVVRVRIEHPGLERIRYATTASVPIR